MEKLDLMRGWTSKGEYIKTALLEWIAENEETTLMEEGEDILDGLEMMEKAGEIPGDILMDSTELITALIVARNLNSDRMPTTFQKDGKSETETKERRVGRASSMIKLRRELMISKNMRKPEGSRRLEAEDFPEMEFSRRARRDSSKRMEIKGLRSDQVNNRLVQDKGVKIQVVGSDVAALYPSLEAVEVAQIIYNAIMESDVKFSGINYQEACRMIALTSSEQECRLGPLRRVLPRRRYNHGSRPGITGEDPLGPDTGSQDQWKFPPMKNGLTELEKRVVIATVMQKSVLAIFKTHTYQFDSKYYLQKKGGPIGLRSTCCVARLVMMWWDEKFLEVVQKSNMTLVDCARYMDDVRVWLHAVRLGWRWINGELLYRSSWRLEERQSGMTRLEKTTEILEGMMNSICSWLVLTMEHEEMFNGVLPTLDLIIWVSSGNKVMFSFYEKEMVSPMVLHKRSAMPEGVRRATLNQELVRRMCNTSELVDIKERVKVVDKYAQKLINSEYDLEEARSIIIGGLKGYERLLSLSKDTTNPKWRPLHMAGSWNSRNRRMAKLKSKNNWYKGKQEVEQPEGQVSGLDGKQKSSSRMETSQAENSPENSNLTDQSASANRMESSEGEGKQSGRGMVKNRKKKRGPDRQTLTLGGKKKMEKNLKRKMKQKMNRSRGNAGFPAVRKTATDKRMNDPPISVIFIDNTKNGALARRLQLEEHRLAKITGYRVRIAESAGMPLSRLLPSTNPWGAGDCGRQDCVLCSQQDETPQDCKRRSILYENRCEICQVDEEKDGKKSKLFLKDGKGVYVGESSRSMYERAKEHQKDREDLSEDSHQVKHWLTEHPELGAPPRFKIKIISSFGDPLTRQLAESVRIEGRGSNILNSKSEYSRCRVPRLRVDMEEWKKKTIKEPTILQEEQLEQEVSLENLEELESGIRRQELKRKGDQIKEKGKKKKMKFSRLTDWGEPEIVSSLQEDFSSLQEDWITRAEDSLRNEDVGGRANIKTSKTRIDEENDKLLTKPSIRKTSISGKVRRKKFEFKKRGKLSREEVKELKRTNKNLFDWLQPEKVGTEVPKDPFDDEDNGWMEKEMREREWRLERVKLRQKTLEAEIIGRWIIKEVLEQVQRAGLEEIAARWLEEIVKTAVEEGEANNIMREIEAMGPAFRKNITQRLESLKLEEEEAMMILITEEAREKMLLKKEKKQLAWKTKYRWLEQGRLAKQFERLEISTIELMEIETWPGIGIMECMEVNEDLEVLSSKMTSRGARRSRNRFQKKLGQVRVRVDSLGRLGEVVELDMKAGKSEGGSANNDSVNVSRDSNSFNLNNFNNFESFSSIHTSGSDMEHTLLGKFRGRKVGLTHETKHKIQTLNLKKNSNITDGRVIRLAVVSTNQKRARDSDTETGGKMKKQKV